MVRHVTYHQCANIKLAHFIVSEKSCSEYLSIYQLSISEICHDMNLASNAQYNYTNTETL